MFYNVLYPNPLFPEKRERDIAVPFVSEEAAVKHLFDVIDFFFKIQKHLPEFDSRSFRIIFESNAIIRVGVFGNIFRVNEDGTYGERITR